MRLVTGERQRCGGGGGGEGGGVGGGEGVRGGGGGGEGGGEVAFCFILPQLHFYS